MIKVDFYLITETTQTARLHFACRLLDKVYQQKQWVYVHTDKPADAASLDDLLWTFREDSFIPHQLNNPTASTLPSPVLIGFNNPPDADKYPVLFNLTQDILPFHDQFKRIIEIVINEENAKKNARQKFRHYKDAGYELTMHDLLKTGG